MNPLSKFMHWLLVMICSQLVHKMEQYEHVCNDHQTATAPTTSMQKYCHPNIQISQLLPNGISTWLAPKIEERRLGIKDFGFKQKSVMMVNFKPGDMVYLGSWNELILFLCIHNSHRVVIGLMLMVLDTYLGLNKGKAVG